MEPTKVWLQKVYFEVDEKLNNDAPVTVDLVIVYEEALLKELAKLTASQYFAKKEQIRRDAGETIDVYTYEIVPGQTLAPQPVKPNHVTGQGALVFARYATPGDHRQAIGPDREVTLQMGTKDFKVIPVKNPSE
jgi:type VI secretion system protein